MEDKVFICKSRATGYVHAAFTTEQLAKDSVEFSCRKNPLLAEQTEIEGVWLYKSVQHI